MTTKIKACANCLHVWYRTGKATDKTWCGKEGVKQRTAWDARAKDGDCGPQGKYFLERNHE